MLASYWMPILVGSALGLVLGGAVVVYRLRFSANAHGIRALNEGRYDEAAQLFGRVVDAGRTKTLAYRTALVNRAVARIDAGRPREALEDLEAAKRLIPPKNKTLRAAWLFNHAYCQIVVDDLEGVPAQIAELQQIDARALRSHIGRLEVLLATRQGNFEEAARIADRYEQDGPEETIARAKRLTLTVHAFALSQLADAPERGDKIASLIQAARAIDAPAPTGIGAEWPAFATFLSANDLG